jgi:hypothetical protein
LNRTISIAPVRKTIVVQTTPEKAFEVVVGHVGVWQPPERMGATAGETMRNSVDGGWPTMLELFAKEAAARTGGHPDAANS